MRQRVSAIPRYYPSLALATAIFLSWVGSVRGQSVPPRPLWGELEPGPFAVGFRVLYRIDRSRTWDPTPDSIARGEFGRPVRVSVWYPARRGPPSTAMPYRDYVHLAAPDAYFRRLDSMLEARNIENLKGIFVGTEIDYPKLLQLAVAARLGATAAAGRFPLVVYSQGWNSGLQHDNSVLAEYLATHGYVVVAVPQVGELSADLTLRINPVDLEVQMRDVEFAMAVAEELPFVEPRRVALLGWSMGGVVALLVSGRNVNIDAVVGLDASFRARDFVKLVLSSPYFDIRRLRAPVLALQSGNAKYVSGQDDRVVDSLRLADRYVGRIADVTHGDFSDFAQIAKLYPVAILDRTAEQASRGHAVMCRYVLAFLDGTLKADRQALAFVTGTPEQNGLPDGLVTIVHREAATVPSEQEFAVMLARDGLERTQGRLADLVARYPGLVIVRQPALTQLGYALLRQHRAELAIQVFRLLTTAYPTSADGFDSLADGYLALADSLGARRAYQRVLELLPADSSLDPSGREELRRRAEQRLGIP
jgi:dienelactone hydrolase